jgi:hypothetical protein
MENNKYFIVLIYDNVFVWNNGCDSVIVLYCFPFIIIYHKYFVYNFKLVKYISRWKNGLDSWYAL